MTLQAFYQTIHGNYDEPMSRLRKEPFLLKYVKLYAQDTTYQELLNAVAAQDWMEAEMNKADTNYKANAFVIVNDDDEIELMVIGTEDNEIRAAADTSNAILLPNR